MPHINEKIDFTVEAFIVHNNRVLLRKHDKYKLWLGVGGHIERDEDPIEAILREVKEEVGLSVNVIGTVPQFDIQNYKELVPPAFLNRHRISPTHEHVTLIYFASSDSDTIMQQEKEISDDCKWFSAEELAGTVDTLTDSVRHYAQAALKAAKSKL